MTTLVFDIETDNLYDDVTKVHCGYTYNIDTQVYQGYRPDEVDQMIHDIHFADTLVMHNGIGYDLPVLEKTQGFVYKGTVYDTMVAARLYNPDIKGGHSLRAWGKRLGVLKGTLDDDDGKVWSEFTEEMFEYNKDDVKVTNALLEFLVGKGYTLDLLKENLITI
ncbi:ribonuclease H-like domain-containing protein [Akkermansiaceae bacterium]|nr:ribonuclease H-like domain-containing protein [Akkermansiaceae bacterium]